MKLENLSPDVWAHVCDVFEKAGEKVAPHTRVIAQELDALREQGFDLTKPDTFPPEVCARLERPVAVIIEGLGAGKSGADGGAFGALLTLGATHELGDGLAESIGDGLFDEPSLPAKKNKPRALSREQLPTDKASDKRK